MAVTKTCGDELQIVVDQRVPQRHCRTSHGIDTTHQLRLPGHGRSLTGTSILPVRITSPQALRHPHNRPARTSRARALRRMPLASTSRTSGARPCPTRKPEREQVTPGQLACQVDPRVAGVHLGLGLVALPDEDLRRCPARFQSYLRAALCRRSRGPSRTTPPPRRVPAAAGRRCGWRCVGRCLGCASRSARSICSISGLNGSSRDGWGASGLIGSGQTRPAPHPAKYTNALTAGLRVVTDRTIGPSIASDLH